MKKDEDASRIVGLAFKKRNEPDTQAMINAAHASVASSFGVTNMTDAQCLALDALDDSIACCHMTIAPPREDPVVVDSINDEELDFFPGDDLACSYPQVMQSVHVHMPPEYYPTDMPYDLDLDAIQLADDETVDSIPTISEPCDPSQAEDTPEANRVCSFPDKTTQGDSGANRGVTNNKDLLHNYQEIVHFGIGTIGPDTISVIGFGYMNLPSLENGLERAKTYYSSKASGSVMSPDRHVKESEQRLRRWIQWGDLTSGHGAVVFIGRDLETVATIRMY